MMTAPAAGVRRRVGQVGGRNPEEGGIGSVHVAAPRHLTVRLWGRPELGAGNSRSKACHRLLEFRVEFAGRPSGRGHEQLLGQRRSEGDGPGPRSRISVPSGARDATVASVPGTNPWAER